MPLAPDQFYARALAAADPAARLPLARVTGWEIFPFEQESLVVKPLDPPVLPEPPRFGEDPASCRACANRREGVWHNPNWRISVFASGAPLVLLMEPRVHYELADLPDELAAEHGVLITHVARHVEALPHIARAHVSRWGDGGAHLHTFFWARPEGFPQLRGSCFTLWDDLLPQTPEDERLADADTVVTALAASFGGEVTTAVP